MATDAIIVLNRLRCLKESDGSGHSEPYLWPVLLWVDDHTLGTPELVGVTNPALGNARVVIKGDMRAGQTADIPPSVGVLRVRLEDGLQVRKLILVLLLLENDETPQKALRAGFQAFPRELRAAIADNLFALNTANEAETMALVKAITTRVDGRVRSAIRGALSASEKVRVALGTLNLDDVVGSDFRFFPDLVASGFTARLKDSSNDYEIQGELQVRPVTVDLCQAQVNRVADAQGAVNGILNEIRLLQEQLQGNTTPGEPTLPKPFIIAEIKRLRQEELPIAEAQLEEARAALQACRNCRPPIAQPVGGGVVVVED
jgi:hypothetical protein